MPRIPTQHELGKSKMMFDYLTQAWANWQSVDNSSHHFDKFIGRPFWRLVDDAANDNVPDEVRRRVELLLGPHFRTIIKAYLAVHDSEEGVHNKSYPLPREFEENESR